MAIGAALVTLLLLLVVHPRLDGHTPIGTAIAAFALLCAVAGSAAIVQHSWSPNALSGRGHLWQVARHYIPESPWLGYGAGSWERLYLTSQIQRAAQNSAHNLWLDVLFAAGWVGVALVVAMAVAAISSAGAARAGVLVALTTIALLGTGHGTLTVGTVDGLTYAILALILTGPTARGQLAPEPTPVRRAADYRGPPRLEPTAVATRAR
jgi:O-antigen ligase